MEEHLVTANTICLAREREVRKRTGNKTVRTIIGPGNFNVPWDTGEGRKTARKPSRSLDHSVPKL